MRAAAIGSENAFAPTRKDEPCLALSNTSTKRYSDIPLLTEVSASADPSILQGPAFQTFKASPPSASRYMVKASEPMPICSK